MSTHVLKSIHRNNCSKCHFWLHNKHFIRKFTQNFQDCVQKIIRSLYSFSHKGVPCSFVYNAKKPGKNLNVEQQKTG